MEHTPTKNRLHAHLRPFWSAHPLALPPRITLDAHTRSVGSSDLGLLSSQRDTSAFQNKSWGVEEVRRPEASAVSDQFEWSSFDFSFLWTGL